MSQPEFTEEELAPARGRDGAHHRRRRPDPDDGDAAQPGRPQGRPGRAPRRRSPQADWEQVRQAIEGARALLPLLEARHAEQLGPVRDTLSRLQMVYAQQAGGAAPPPAEAPERRRGRSSRSRPSPGSRARRSAPARLWIPGQ